MCQIILLSWLIFIWSGKLFLLAISVLTCVLTLFYWVAAKLWKLSHFVALLSSSTSRLQMKAGGAGRPNIFFKIKLALEQMPINFQRKYIWNLNATQRGVCIKKWLHKLPNKMCTNGFAQKGPHDTIRCKDLMEYLFGSCPPVPLPPHIINGAFCTAWSYLAASITEQAEFFVARLSITTWYPNYNFPQFFFRNE